MNSEPVSVRNRAAEDRRVARTRRALGNALVELMLTEEFDGITVQRVLDRASVGRSTFYAHFRNLDDLLLSDAERFFTALEEHFERHERGGRRVAPVAELLAHVREFEAFQRALERSGRAEEVHDLLAGHLAQIVERRLRRLVDLSRLPLPPALAARAWAGALLEMLRWWLGRGAKESPAWVDARYHDLVWAGLGGEAEGSGRAPAPK